MNTFLSKRGRENIIIFNSPTISELPDAVIDQMVKKDKAFWVDKPGANAYTLHDAYYNYGMTTEKVLPSKIYLLYYTYLLSTKDLGNSFLL